MKTLTVTEAQAKLPAILRRVGDGEDIGIIAEGQIIQLKAVDVLPWEDSYACQEYDLTPAEWEQFKTRMNRRRSGERYPTFEGKFDPASLA